MAANPVARPAELTLEPEKKESETMFERKVELPPQHLPR
jgi:hypothetical protein